MPVTVGVVSARLAAALVHGFDERDVPLEARREDVGDVPRGDILGHDLRLHGAGNRLAGTAHRYGSSSNRREGVKSPNPPSPTAARFPVPALRRPVPGPAVPRRRVSGRSCSSEPARASMREMSRCCRSAMKRLRWFSVRAESGSNRTELCHDRVRRAAQQALAEHPRRQRQRPGFPQQRDAHEHPRPGRRIGLSVTSEAPPLLRSCSIATNGSSGSPLPAEGVPVRRRIEHAQTDFLPAADAHVLALLHAVQGGVGEHQAPVAVRGFAARHARRALIPRVVRTPERHERRAVRQFHRRRQLHVRRAATTAGSPSRRSGRRTRTSCSKGRAGRAPAGSPRSRACRRALARPARVAVLAPQGARYGTGEILRPDGRVVAEASSAARRQRSNASHEARMASRLSLSGAETGDAPEVHRLRVVEAALEGLPDEPVPARPAPAQLRGAPGGDGRAPDHADRRADHAGAAQRGVRVQHAVRGFGASRSWLSHSEFGSSCGPIR